VIGDWETQVELAKHVDALVRQRQGLMGTRDAGALAGPNRGMGTDAGAAGRTPEGTGRTQTVGRKPEGTGRTQTVGHTPEGTGRTQDLGRMPEGSGHTPDRLGQKHRGSDGDEES